jgi:hypothetical protein
MAGTGSKTKPQKELRSVDLEDTKTASKKNKPAKTNETKKK